MKAVVAVTMLVAVAAGAMRGPAPESVSPDFVHDVSPLLQRAGCSSAYCHGGATGQARFALSLFGSDPIADHVAITQAFGGRRIDLAAPARSLLVRKALGRLDHGGGRRMTAGGAGHRLLEAWIAGGAHFSAGPARDATALRLERRGDRLVALATVGGAERDVTDVASFASSDAGVLAVDPDGALHEVAPGVATAIARYGAAVAVLRVVRPFTRPEIAAGVPTAAPHELDGAWAAHLHELGLQPASPVSPAELARRLWLDVAGRGPTPQELREFTATPDVAGAVRRLAAAADFPATWGGWLADWLEVPAEAAAQRAALVAAVAARRPLGAIARDVVSGRSGELYRRADPRDRADAAARILLGLRVGCARCHDHPDDRWRRREHQAFSACFADPRPDGAGGTMAGLLFDEDSGAAVTPRLLALGAASPPPFAGGREALADFVLDRSHDRFARTVCNRVFAALVGRGLVEPLDDHRPGNPPLSAAMLDALVARYHANGGDLVDLVAFVATSAVYRVGSESATAPSARWLAAAAPRPLPERTFASAVTAATGRPLASPLPSSPLARELALANGEAVAGMLARGGTTVDAIFELGPDAPTRLDDLWHLLLARPPHAAEIARFLAFADDLEAFRDLAYALLTGREFGTRR